MKKSRVEKVEKLKVTTMKNKKTNKNLENTEYQPHEVNELVKNYTKKEVIDYLENEIKECMEYYPIPNLFLGSTCVEESLIERQKIIDELENKIRVIKKINFNKKSQ